MAKPDGGPWGLNPAHKGVLSDESSRHGGAGAAWPVGSQAGAGACGGALTPSGCCWTSQKQLLLRRRFQLPRTDVAAAVAAAGQPTFDAAR